ncbi:TIGR04376 family protein [Pleurocapsales cyanobacterium LEGE 06147]|nr:TIGR04376 family protein [Pleurocapsales cyanobacterium LEGE 06147]
MGLFDDFSQFLEERLDEFLRNNPHLELQAIEEQLREQEQDTQRLILDLQRKEKNLQEEILSVAQDIQVWHGRVSKAEAAGRQDLAEAAKEREAALLRQGNQLWGQMEGTKQRVIQARELLQQIQQRRQEVKAKYEQVKAASVNSSNTATGYTAGWERGVNTSGYNRAADPLEAQFQNWELDEELDRMKRNLGR